MTGRLRYAIVAAFVALFFLFPAANDERIAFLQVKDWLTKEGWAGDRSLVEAIDAAHAPGDPALASVPALVVSYAVEGGSTAESADRAREFVRTFREWARGVDRPVDPDRSPLELSIRVGPGGYAARASQDGGGELAEPVTLEMRRDGGGANPVYYPNRFSLTPAFLAIVVAILTGRVIPALLLGCLAGAWLWKSGPIATLDHFATETVWNKVFVDQFRLEIIGFVFFLFMAVGVMTRSGGIQGMVEVVRRFARGPVSAQLASWIIGVLIFFDDYSNCVVTGSTMRPLTDRCGVAREKLAYIVDSTAAPVAGVSIFSTWVAYEVSMFAPQLPEVARADGTPFTVDDGFGVFVQTLPLRFYCGFTILMVFLTIVLRREFGPMLHAARRAHEHGRPLADDAKPLVSKKLDAISPDGDSPLRARNAIVPLVLLVVTTLALILWFGLANLGDTPLDGTVIENVSAILNGGESQRALCWSAAAAFLVALALAVGQRILTLGDALASALRSAQSLVFAVVILILAWSIGEICQDVGTAQFLTATLDDSVSPWTLPAVLFGIASLVAFSTGTSYGTMSILLPNVVVLAYTIGQTDPAIGGTALVFLTIGAVLEGSIFGDHCSPISDTTVLSSVATGSDHMHHVRTQAPYAVLTMLVAMLCGYVPCALLGPEAWPLAWAGGAAVLVVVLLVFGRDPFRRPAG